MPGSPETFSTVDLVRLKPTSDIHRNFETTLRKRHNNFFPLI